VKRQLNIKKRRKAREKTRKREDSREERSTVRLLRSMAGLRNAV
jgi:hypothetical protein